MDAPEVVTLMREIAAKAKAKGVLLGAFCDTPENARLLKQEGFQYIAYSVDVNVFLEACKSLKGMVNE